MGLAYAHNGKLHVSKGYSHLTKFITALKKVPEGSPTMIHFRWASVGKINKENCHPFHINEHHAMVHNGTIPGMGNDECSDSRYFNDEILRPLFNQVGTDIPLESPNGNFHLRYLIAGAIGASRMVILREDGQRMIIGEARGEWIGGSWYSNTKSLLPVPPPEPPKKKGDRRVMSFKELSQFSLNADDPVPDTKLVLDEGSRLALPYPDAKIPSPAIPPNAKNQTEAILGGPSLLGAGFMDVVSSAQ